MMAIVIDYIITNLQIYKTNYCKRQTTKKRRTQKKKCNYIHARKYTKKKHVDINGIKLLLYKDHYYCSRCN